MKKVLLVLSVILMSAAAFAQKGKDDVTAPTMPIDDETKLITYTGVVEFPGVTAAEFYKRAMKWMKEYYPSASSVIQTADTVNGKIIGRAKFDTRRTLKDGTTAAADRVQYTITLLFKDGKYKYEITKINIAAASQLPIEKYFDEKDPNKNDHFNTLTQADDTFLALVHSLKERMSQPSEKAKKDDW